MLGGDRWPAFAEVTRRFSWSGITALAAASGNRLEALYVLAVTTGMRRASCLGCDGPIWTWTEECCKYAHAAADTRGYVIAETKTARSRRQIVLTQTAVEAPRRHRISQATERLQIGASCTDHGLVFTNEIGNPLDASNLLRRSFEPLLKAAGAAAYPVSRSPSHRRDPHAQSRCSSPKSSRKRSTIRRLRSRSTCTAK